MAVKTQEAGLSDVVYIVNWLAEDSDGVNEARNGGDIELPAPEGTFTPYDQLTEQQVLGWVWAALGDEIRYAIEADLNAQIMYMQIPPVAVLPLPWANTLEP
jgi:hypothetical protein